ncbi:MAG: hypothetical protein COA63_006635 [Methylophaga sp.]|nr:hypothetical protein [Methylophaga sp.]
MSKKVFISAIVTLFCSATLHAEQTKEISFGQLPKIVQSSALKHIVQTGIKKVEVIQDEGITKYEIESKTDGIIKDISFATNGMVLEIEQSMQFTQLPIVAQQAVKKEYPNIKITEVESVQEFYFDVEGDDTGKLLELKVFASGDIEDD